MATYDTNGLDAKTEGQRAYQEYLFSTHWADLRGAALARDRVCKKCRGHKKLQVHHTFYRPSWYDTQIEDLLTLCKNCHRAEHGLKPVRIRQKKKRGRKEKKHQTGVPPPKRIVHKERFGWSGNVFNGSSVAGDRRFQKSQANHE